jgi:hypothetical protein
MFKSKQYSDLSLSFFDFESFNNLPCCGCVFLIFLLGAVFESCFDVPAVGEKRVVEALAHE